MQLVHFCLLFFLLSFQYFILINFHMENIFSFLIHLFFVPFSCYAKIYYISVEFLSTLSPCFICLQYNYYEKSPFFAYALGVLSVDNENFKFYLES